MEKNYHTGNPIASYCEEGRRIQKYLIFIIEDVNESN